MSKLKEIILIFIDTVNQFFFLNNLNKHELKGFVDSLTKLRFLPYTKITVPFHLGRTIRGVSFDKNLYQDPYGKLCKNISEGIDHKIIFSNLLKELEREKNLSAADIVNLENNITLKGYPAWSIVMPWENVNIEEKFNLYPYIFFRNRSSKGLEFDDKSRESIINEMYSLKSLESKVNQMIELYKSIKQNFLKSNNNLPKINILIKENEWRWFMGDAGNHRSYILSCINHNFFNARVYKIINKNNAKNWYNVKNGTYSIKDAENIFDSFFHGSHVIGGII